MDQYFLTESGGDNTDKPGARIVTEYTLNLYHKIININCHATGLVAHEQSSWSGLKTLALVFSIFDGRKFLFTQ